MSIPKVHFGDKVRIRPTDVTEAMGIAGMVGIVHGQTAPSVTSVEVIGEKQDDHAIAVMIEGRKEALWFAEELLELVDCSPGTMISVAGRRFTRDARGEWRES